VDNSVDKYEDSFEQAAGTDIHGEILNVMGIGYE